MSTAPPSKTILIVEDEPLIAIDLEALVVDMGYNPMPVSHLGQALALASSEAIDFALLDYAVRSRDTGPIAMALRARRIPFLVCSGSQLHEVAEALQGAPFVAKPYATDVLREAIRAGLDTKSPSDEYQRVSDSR